MVNGRVHRMTDLFGRLRPAPTSRRRGPNCGRLTAPLGLGADFPFRWLIALGLGVGLGALIGAFQGFIIAYVGVPSFIVTLGGLLSIRGAVWVLSSGAAVSGLDSDFQLIGGSAQGSIGGTATWAIGIVGALAILGLLAFNRRQRRRFGFPLRPDVGRGAPGRRRLRRRARPGGLRQRGHLARRRRHAICRKRTGSPNRRAG